MRLLLYSVLPESGHPDLALFCLFCAHSRHHQIRWGFQLHGFVKVVSSITGTITNQFVGSRSRVLAAGPAFAWGRRHARWRRGIRCAIPVGPQPAPRRTGHFLGPSQDAVGKMIDLLGCHSVHRSRHYRQASLSELHRCLFFRQKRHPVPTA